MIGYITSHLKESQGEGFYRSLYKLAIPIILQHLMMSSLNLIDNIMVGRLGDAATGAVGLANQYFFILILYLVGVGGGTAMFSAQFWGKKDIENVRRTLGISFLLSVPFAAILGVISIFTPEIIFTFFGAQKDVTELGTSYLVIVGWGAPIFAISYVYGSSLRSIEQAHIPMATNIIAVVLNTCLNYLLIFGKFGCPALGVEGAAYATLFSRIVECSILFAASYYKHSPIAVKPLLLFQIRRQLLKRFLSQSGLIIFKDVVWALGNMIYMMIYSRMSEGSVSTSNIAAVHIFFTINEFAYLLFFGIGSASQIMVGKCIGEDDVKKAFSHARRILLLTVLLSFAVGFIFYQIRPLFLLPYNVSETTIKNVMGLLTVFALYMPFTTFCMVAVLGHMRSGGDTVIVIIMDLIAQYLIGLPLALLAGFYFNYPLPVVFAMVMIQEIFKGVVLIRRFRSGKWIRNLVHDLV